MVHFFNYITASLILSVGVLTLCSDQPLGVLFGCMMFAAIVGSYSIIPKFWDMYASTNMRIVEKINNYFKYN